MGFLKEEFKYKSLGEIFGLNYNVVDLWISIALISLVAAILLVFVILLKLKAKKEKQIKMALEEKINILEDDNRKLTMCNDNIKQELEQYKHQLEEKSAKDSEELHEPDSAEKPVVNTTKTTKVKNTKKTK